MVFGNVVGAGSHSGKGFGVVVKLGNSEIHQFVSKVNLSVRAERRLLVNRVRVRVSLLADISMHTSNIPLWCSLDMQTCAMHESAGNEQPA